MSDVEPPTQPTNRWTLTASCVCVCVQQQRRCQPKNIILLQNQHQNIHPEVTGSLPCLASPSLLTPGGFGRPLGHPPRSPWNPACGPRCSGSSCCSPRCPGSSHGRGQRSPEGPPGCRRRMRSSALPCKEGEEERRCVTASVRCCRRVHDRGCCVGFSRAQAFLCLTVNWMAAKLLEGCRSY